MDTQQQQEQQEDSIKDLQGTEAKKKIKDMAEAVKSCFFVTNITTGQSLSTRPMSPQKVDDDGIFWFLSNKESHKNMDLKTDSNVQLLFQGSAYSDFLSIYGTATITEDKSIIKELWDPTLKTWFTEGVDDPRISVIKVEPLEGYYWDTKNGAAVALVKRLAGAIVGKTIDDSVEGTISV